LFQRCPASHLQSIQKQRSSCYDFTNTPLNGIIILFYTPGCRKKKEISLRLQFQARLRGIYYLPPPHLFVGDPSGLFRGMNQVGKEQYLYVFPRLLSTGDLFKTLDLQENNREYSFGLEDRYQVFGYNSGSDNRR